MAGALVSIVEDRLGHQGSKIHQKSAGISPIRLVSHWEEDFERHKVLSGQWISSPFDRFGCAVVGGGSSDSVWLRRGVRISFSRLCL